VERLDQILINLSVLKKHLPYGGCFFNSISV
jgi:hypothetical protein